MSRDAFVIGFFLGGLTGAAAALLMAPQPGEQTRAQLQERSIELRAQVEDLKAEARNKAEKLTTKLQERGHTVISEETIEGSAEEH